MDKSPLWLLILPLVLLLIMGGWLLHHHLTRDDPIESVEVVYLSSFDIYLGMVMGPDGGEVTQRDLRKIMDEKSQARGYVGWVDLCEKAAEKDPKAFAECVQRTTRKLKKKAERNLTAARAGKGAASEGK